VLAAGVRGVSRPAARFIDAPFKRGLALRGVTAVGSLKAEYERMLEGSAERLGTYIAVLLTHYLK